MSFIATVFQWVFYGLGVLFTILLLFSALMNPILFNKKWKAVITYGSYAIIYFALWFFMFNLQNTTYVNNISTSNDTVKTSSVSNQSVNNNSSNVSKSNAESSGSTTTNATTSTVARAVNQSTTNNKVSDESAKQYVDSNGKGTIIGDTDSKIYHVPGSTYYNREMQKTSNNVYFKTTAEAQAAGYRAPKR